MARAVALVAMLAVLMQARADGRLYEPLLDPASVPLSDVLGMTVRTPDGRRLGTIRDLLFDRATGKVEQVMLEYTSYPIDALVASERPREIILDLTFAGLASVGATALVAQAQQPLSRASREGGGSAGLVVDLRDGRLKSAQP